MCRTVGVMEVQEILEQFQFNRGRFARTAVTIAVPGEACVSAYRVESRSQAVTVTARTGTPTARPCTGRR